MNPLRRLRERWRAGAQFFALLRTYAALVRRIKKANAPSAEKDFAAFRMCCHVLDKGLSIRPFEPGHSRPIYQGACQARDAVRTRHGDKFQADAAWQWGENILREYEEAQRTGIGASAEAAAATDLLAGLPPEVPEWIRQGMARRVSCRDLADREVPDEIWRRIVGSAVEAPTSCCRQAVRFRILHDPERVRAASRCIAGATGYSRGIPYLVCVSADLRMYADVRDSLLPYLDAALALDAFSLAAACERISVTILNFQRATARECRRVRELFAVPECEQIVVFASAGYPAALPRKPVRRPVETFLQVIP
ncbi:MAG: nitroreductase family protein [Kiritimatiellia bacterium]